MTAHEVHEITVQSGARFTGPSFQDAWREYWKHMCATVAEGMCSQHATPLEPFPAKPGFVSGRCGDCRTYYAYEPATGEVHENFYIAGLPTWAA